MKTLAAGSTLVVLLCGPALADQVTKLVTPVDVGLVVANGGAPRHYAVKLVDDSCGSAQSKVSGKSDDTIKVCVKDGAQLRVELDWYMRDGAKEIHNSSTILAKRGGTFALESDGAKLTVTVN